MSAVRIRASEPFKALRGDSMLSFSCSLAQGVGNRVKKHKNPAAATEDNTRTKMFLVPVEMSYIGNNHMGDLAGG